MYSEKLKKNLSYQSEPEKKIKNIVNPPTEPLTLDKMLTKLSQIETFHLKRR